MNGDLPIEFSDYRLIRDLYHCTPEELDRQDDTTVELHGNFMALDARERNYNERRAEQRKRNNI